MTFLAPWAFWLASLAPVIVVLYLLKLRRRAVSVSSLMFWQRVLQESRRRALFQRLRQLLSLLLHLLIFALILLALAKPTFDRAVRSGSSTVIVLDTRARMQALEADGQSRWQKALALAAQTARQAGEFRQVAILIAAADAAVAAPFSDDEKALRETLARLRPTDAAGELAPALQLADELLASRSGDRRILLLTAPGTPPPSDDYRAPITFVPIGTARDNVAITRFAARPLPASSETSEILLEVRNFSRAAVSGNVELSLDGRLLDVHPFQLAPDGRSVEIFASVPPASNGSPGWLTARLDTRDALAADDTAFASLPTRPPRRVLLVTRGNWFLEKLLEADTRLHFELLAPDAFQPRMAAQFDAVLFDAAVPAGFDLRSAVGNLLFIKSTPFSAGDKQVEQPVITEADAHHPLLRLVNLQNVSFAHAAKLTPPEPRDGWTFSTPLSSGEAPLLITGSRRTASGDQRLAALAFDLAESDLPLRVAFPLLMAYTIHWLAGDDATETRSIRAGEAVSLAAEEAISASPQAAPAVPPSTAFVRNSFLPSRNGFYAVTRPGEPPAWLAVNTFSERESDLRTARSEAAPASSPPASLLTAPLAGWPLWRYLVLAAAALFTGEWWLFHRRSTE